MCQLKCKSLYLKRKWNGFTCLLLKGKRKNVRTFNDVFKNKILVTNGNKRLREKISIKINSFEIVIKKTFT